MGLVDAGVPLRVLENTARMLTLEAPAPRKLPLAAAAAARAAARASSPRRRASRSPSSARREHYPAPYAILDLWQKYGGDPFARADDPIRARCQRCSRIRPARNLIRIFFLQERMKALGKGVRLQGAARARGRRRRDGRRHRRVVRHARHHRDAAGHGARAHRAGDEARARAVQAAPARPAPHPRRDGPADPGRRRRRRGAGRRDHRGDLREPGGQARAVRASSRRRRSPARSSRPTPPASSSPTSPRTSRIRRGWWASTSSIRCRRCSWSRSFVPQTPIQRCRRSAAAFVRQIDKLPLPVKDSPGFLVNRVLGPYMQNAFRMLDEGVKPETHRRRDGGLRHADGPDRARRHGRPGHLPARRQGAREEGRARQRAGSAAVLLNKVALGQLGKKTGQGIYRWENGKPVKGQPGA